MGWEQGLFLPWGSWGHWAVTLGWLWQGEPSQGCLLALRPLVEGDTCQSMKLSSSEQLHRGIEAQISSGE